MTASRECPRCGMPRTAGEAVCETCLLEFDSPMDPPPSAWRRRLPIIGAAGVVVIVAALIVVNGGLRLPVAGYPDASASPTASDSPAPSSPSPSEPDETAEPSIPASLAGMEIAYAVRSGTGPTIHIMAADGTNDRMLAPGSSPAWSVFAGSLTYNCGVASAESIGDLCSIGVDGENQSVLIADAFNPRWSPTGSHLMFSRSPFDLGDTWVVNLLPNPEGTQPTLIGDGRGTWSPDGSRIMLVSGGSGIPVVSIVGPDGSPEYGPIGEGWGAAWGPHGQIAFHWNGDLQVHSLVADAPVVIFDQVPGGELAWVTDNLIAIGSDEGVYLFDLGSRELRELASGPSVRTAPVVSPDGQWLAFAAWEGDASDIYVVNVAGGDPIRLTSDGASESPAWRSSAVTVTFRLTLSGTVPDDATFAVQDGILGGAQHAVYLCAYYGGYPACESGASYDDPWSGPAGIRLEYRFWRELVFPEGATEQMESGELISGPSDQVITVEYAFPP